MDSQVALSRSRLATAVRLGDPQSEHSARCALAEAKLADYIRKTVDAAPPLDAATRDRLALLLRGGEAP